ncbi:MAG: radical SAM protein [Candidatus Omnitrophota bacterium]
MARVCLVRPPFFKLYGIEKVHFPLSIGYLASYLERGGHEVSFVDGEVFDYGLYEGILYKGIINAALFYADPYFIERKFNVVGKVMEDPRHRVWDTLIGRIAAARPDVVGISCYTINMTAVNIISERIKSEIGDIPVVLGGIHPTALPAETLEQVRAADFAVMGEGEVTLLDLVNDIGDGKRTGLHIAGVVERGSADFKPRELITDLDSIPFPKRDFYDKSNYIFGAPLLTSRGCPFSCTFCASHLMWGRKVRNRSVRNVIEELKVLAGKFDAGRIRILDDTFVLNKPWIMEFCAELKASGLKLSFNCSGRINTVDEDLFRVLSDSGFDSIAFGIESGSDRIVKSINKNIDLSRVVDVIKTANRYGFDTTSFYMTGHPGETAEDIRKSADLFIRSMSKRGELSMLVPYPKTDAGERAVKQGFEFRVGDAYKMQHARNRVLFNMTQMPDAAFLAEHKRFERIIMRRNYMTLFKKMAKMAVRFITGRLK